MIISILNKESGFYSLFFFTINHYLYCKKNNINFKLNTDEWLFKYLYGWTDYFENIELNYNLNDIDIQYYKNCQCIDNFPIKCYKNIINEIYIYNKNTLEQINNTKKNLNLLFNDYDSIFIRRGDKLIKESKYINSVEYLDFLLIKNPSCKKIFLQTDDYNCYIELKEYINNNNLNIELLTLCNENIKGIVVFDFNLNTIKNNNIEDNINREYLNKNNEIKLSKSVNEMNNIEIYKHTIDMIIGIDIILKSNICVTDYQSNVSRFIKLAHQNSDTVYDILSPNVDIDYDRNICPAYCF